MNELRIFESNDDQSRAGFRTILAGPEHSDYAKFCPAAGHGLGINDLKVIEVRNVIAGMSSDSIIYPGLEEGWRVQQVIKAMEISNIENKWIKVANMYRQAAFAAAR